MLMVILGHQFERYALVHHLQIIQTFHMPLFFIISGYFISEKESIKAFVHNRARRLLAPYAIGCGVMVLACSIRQWISLHSINAVAEEIQKRIWISLYGSGSGHGSFIGPYGCIEEVGMFWYLLALLWASIIVRVIISKSNQQWIVALLISSIGIETSMTIGWIPFSIQAGLGAVFWVYLGYYIKSRDLLSFVVNLFQTRYWLLVIPVWLLSAVFGCIHVYGNLYQLGIVDILGAVCGSWIVFVLCSWIATSNTGLRRVLIFVGQNTLLIYSLHFVENSVYPVSDLLIRLQVFGNVTLCIVSWIVISIASIILTMVLTKLSVVRKIYY